MGSDAADQVDDAAAGPDDTILLVCWKGAPRGKIVRVARTDPKLAEAVTVRPQDDGMLCNWTVAGRRVFAVSRRDGSAIPVLLIGARVTLTTGGPNSNGKHATTVLPSPGVILASLKRQLASFLAGVKIGKITKYETKTYVGRARILDLDKSAADSEPVAAPRQGSELSRGRE